MPPPAVTCIIISYNPGPEIHEALEALAAQTYEHRQIMVYDNASVERAEVDRLTLPGGARFIQGDENLGFAGGNNRVIEMLDTPLVALINPDARPEPDWLERMVAALEAHPGAVMAAGKQLMAEDPSRLDGAGDNLHLAGVPYRGGFGRPDDVPNARGEVFGPCGAGALYRRAAFLAAGGFDEDFFCYVEDVDIALRLRMHGGWCVFEPRAVLYHIGSATMGRRSDFAIYHGARNRIWMLANNLPPGLLVAVSVLHLPIWCMLFARTALRRRAEAAALWRGTVDGVRGLKRQRDKRRARLARQRISTWQLARSLTWSPVKLFTRGVDIRPLPDQRGRS